MEGGCRLKSVKLSLTDQVGEAPVTKGTGLPRTGISSPDSSGLSGGWVHLGVNWFLELFYVLSPYIVT